MPEPNGPTLVTPPQGSGLWSVVMYVVDKPQALAIIFALVLLGMFLGIVPSVLTQKQAVADTKLDTIISNQASVRVATESEYADLMKALADATLRSDTKNDQLIKIMRGMCLLQAKQSNDSAALSYCNP
jgi:ABC-type lipoprotein release transport system permease subunit